MSDSQHDFNSDDLVAKIVEASTFESEGNLEKALALYQEIAEQDLTGNYGDVAREALSNLQDAPAIASESADEEKNLGNSASWWHRIGIKTKASIILTSITLSASLGISFLTYQLTSRSITRQNHNFESFQTETLTKAVSAFMNHRYGDMKILSNLQIVADPELRNSRNALQKRSILNQYIQEYQFYDSIIAYDLEGNIIASSIADTSKFKPNADIFDNVLRFDQPQISQPLASQDVNFSRIHLAAPIKDTTTGKTIGAIYATMPVSKINESLFALDSQRTFYIFDSQGQIFISSDPKINQTLSANDSSNKVISGFGFASKLQQQLNLRSNGSSLVDKDRKSFLQGNQKIGYLSSFSEINNQFIKDISFLNWTVLTEVDKYNVFIAQRKLLEGFIIGSVIIALVVTILSRLIAEQIAQPILNTAETVKQLGQGYFDARVPVSGKDEIADLGNHINKMAGQIQDLLHTQESEAQRQRKEKERLQQGVMGLLLDVEDAKKGDLTVRAQMSDGAVGSIADAFNATLKKLQVLLQEVQGVSSEVSQLSMAGENSVRQLSESADKQALEIDLALGSIDEINQSVKSIADYAKEAATIARNGSIQAKEGDLAMDATVNSIEKIRTTVANTSKKVKQLAESSQEIAQIVEIISGISEKTNLLAFNASVEAARAGEHGEGFRIVAEEVRRLADRTTGATKDIQQLVTTIQQDTTLVLQGMETSTSEVVNGSELVHMTKLNLRSLAQTSEQIDEYLKSISTNTTKQTDNSKQINEKISGIALVAKTTSAEAQGVVESLQTLVQEAQNLQESVSQFKLQDQI